MLYQVLSSLIFEPTAITAFNATLERLKSDPRITVRIGEAGDIRGESDSACGEWMASCRNGMAMGAAALRGHGPGTALRRDTVPDLDEQVACHRAARILSLVRYFRRALLCGTAAG